MKLIIDIPEEEYDSIKEIKYYIIRQGSGKKLFNICLNSIANGIPLEKIRVEIKEKIEQEEFARSVFRHEEKDTVKAEQCTGSIMAYKNVIMLFDKYKAESELKGE